MGSLLLSCDPYKKTRVMKERKRKEKKSKIIPGNGAGKREYKNEK